MRVVFDTNIFIAAALRGEFSAKLIALAEKGIIRLILSEEILQELRQKLIKKFDWSEDKVDFFIRSIKKLAEVIEVTEEISVITRDPEDDKILECALASKADLIVTLDQDLIKLKNFKGIGIVHPKTLSWTFPKYFKKSEN